MRSKYKAHIIITFFLLFGVNELLQAQLGSFANRKKFIIESDSVSGSTNLLNFPVLINVNLPPADVENANGFDIAFSAADGTTALDFELESYNSGSGNVIAWVRFPTLSPNTDTQFFIYYGDSGIGADQSEETTWNSNYQLVMHMDGGATETDGTANGNNGSQNGTGGIPIVTGQIGNARDFERDDADFIQVPDASSLDITANITLSFWFNQESAITPDFISKGINLSYEATARNGIRARFAKNGGNNLNAPAINAFINSHWVYLSYVQNPTGRIIYQNGVIVASDANTTAFIANNDPLYISRSADAVDGIMDEVRISNTNRSADWILTEYKNQLNPSTFIEELADVPGLSNIETSTQLYTAGGSAVFVTSTLTIDSHPTISDLTSATIQITENLDNPDDQLNFVDTGSITGSYVAGTGTLTLSGTTTLANYQTAIRSVTFESLSGSPSPLTRTISITGFNGSDATNILTRDLDIITTLTNLTTDISDNVFHLDAQDVDDDGIANTADGATISTWVDLNTTNNFDFTTGNAATYDTDGFGERGSVVFDGTADELIRGTETLINNSIFSEKSFAIVFRTSNDISGFQVIYEQAVGGRGYNFTLEDGVLYAQAYSRGDANWGGSNAVRHKSINLGAVQANESYTVIAYHDSNIWTAQVNNGTFSSFTDAGDMPAATGNSGLGGNDANMRNPVTQANEDGNFNGQIAEFASWNTALNGGEVATLNSYFEDKWGNSPPTLAAIEGTNIDFTESDSDVQITNTITVTDDDPHLNMDSVRVSVTTNFVTGEDSLIFANTANITGIYDEISGVLLLTGRDTKANYQTALRSISYRNSTVNPTASTRTIEFEIFDWDDVSNTTSRSINVIDDAITPILDDIEVIDLVYEEEDGTISITSEITIDDFDDSNMESATISISNNYFSGEDFLDFVDTGNITGSFASGTGILTLSGADTKANYETALRAVTYENTSSDPVELDRTVSFLVNDGDNNSNMVTRDITVAATNSKPVLSSIESGNLAYPNTNVQITNTIVISDPDDTRLDSAIVVISENFKPAEDSLVYSTLFGITGTYNTINGRLKLVGNNLLSDYQAALRSIDYKNYATIASGPERVVSFIVSDGSLKSDSLKRTIDVSPVETIPNLEVWLRADAGILVSDGQEITTWADQSGNGYNFTGAVDATVGGATRPTYIASSSNLNNQPSVNFIGNGDHFISSDYASYINGETEFTLFVVYIADGINSDRGLFIAENPVGDDKTLTIRYDAVGANGANMFTNVVKTGILNGNPEDQLESFSDIQTTNPQIISLQWESDVTFDLYVDGILNNPSYAAAPPNDLTITASTAILGRGGKDTDAIDRSWDGEIAEFIYYGRSITQIERESIENYLADKYDQAIRKITPATGGEAISADSSNVTDGYIPLSGPFVQEGFIGEFTASGTFVLTAPSGYEWNTGASIGITESPAFGGSTELDASFTSATSSSITFDIDTESSTNPGQLEFTGLEIRPTTGIIPNTGNITNSGTTGQGGATNYGTITMVPGSNDSLIFTQQPSTTNIDSSITPAVRVQLVDQYGNSIEQAGVDISIALATGSTGTLDQTTPISTNVLGIAEFDTLSIDALGTKELVATSTGLSSDTSSTFEIVNAGTLTQFIVERVPSGNISAKTAGQTFNIIITAVDGTSTTVTTFNGTVVISSSCTMGTGQGTSASFTNGVLASTTVSITSVGNCTIASTNSAGSEFGTSNSFTVSAGAASETTSTITASPTVILNDMVSTSTITVNLKDVYGNDLTAGGDAVTLTIIPTALGSLGSVTDNTDGTYSATLTSSTTIGTDNITGTVNAVSITDDANVEYAAFSHIWNSQLGSASLASDWEDTGNWSAGTTPGLGDVVFIPATPSVGNEQPVIDVAGSSVASVTMETGASLTISGSINFTITGNLSGGSILGTNADSLTIGGDVLDVSTINVGTVILNGSTAQQVTNPHSYTNLEIDNSSGVTIEQNLIISDSLFMTSGELLIPSGIDLVVEGIRYGTGVLRFQRTITGNIGWRILSSPVATTYGDFLDGVLTQGYSGAFYDISSSPGDTVQPNVITYLENEPGTDNQRFRAPTSSAQSLTAGQGIFVFFFGDIAADSRYKDPLPDTLDASGQEFGLLGEVDFNVTYTTIADSGWNLVGNPYGATLDWDDVPSWTKTDIDATIYIWDPAANGGNGEYLTWNGTTGTLGSGLIAPFQGFWIKANSISSDLKVTTEAKTTGGAFLRKQTSQLVPELPMFELEITSSGLQKKTSVMFSEKSSEDIDPLDAYTLTPLVNSRLDLHTLLKDGTPLAINSLPLSLTNRVQIPLVIRGYKDGVPISADYDLRFINADNLPEDWVVLLIDKETGKEVNLIIDEEQTLFHNTTEVVNVGNPLTSQELVFLESLSTRFTLLITTEEIESNIPRSIYLEQNYPNPFNPTTKIPFGLDKDSDVTLEVFDILGRKVITLFSGQKVAGNHTVTFNTGNLSSGVYFYRLVTNSKVLVKKLTLIK